jgi:hypothetical protein
MLEAFAIVSNYTVLDAICNMPTKTQHIPLHVVWEVSEFIERTSDDCDGFRSIPIGIGRTLFTAYFQDFNIFVIVEPDEDSLEYTIHHSYRHRMSPNVLHCNADDWQESLAELLTTLKESDKDDEPQHTSMNSALRSVDAVDDDILSQLSEL